MRAAVQDVLAAAVVGQAAGVTNNRRGENILDSGSHFYEVYETSDGKYVSVAAIEPKFYAQFLELTGISSEALPQRVDRDERAALRVRLAEVMKTKTRDEWCARLEGTDCCFAPVLDMDEAAQHPHNQERQTFVEVDGVVQPNAAPRFSRTPAEIKEPPTTPGAQTESALKDWGFSESEIESLTASGVIGSPPEEQASPSKV